MFSYFPILSCRASRSRFAFAGVITILLTTSGFGIPGSEAAKSVMTSFLEWVMIARLEYVPFAMSCFISKLRLFPLFVLSIISELYVHTVFFTSDKCKENLNKFVYLQAIACKEIYWLMELSAKYNPAETEDKWYAWWLENRFFHSEPDGREPYTVVIPPPNVTGILHMGHVLNNTLNDVLVRKARMDGKNACWVPGTDHASIATESKVVAKLKEQGISKDDITREEFLRHAWEWKEKHGGIILSQLRKLGASCDWDRTKFTMDPDLSKAVINTFVYFYNKGYIYRGVRMVNWDPVGLTAVSDEEVIHRDTTSKFYHLRYFISDGNGNPTEDFLVIATTRPEMIMADAVI